MLRQGPEDKHDGNKQLNPTELEKTPRVNLFALYLKPLFPWWPLLVRNTSPDYKFIISIYFTYSLSLSSSALEVLELLSLLLLSSGAGAHHHHLRYRKQQHQQQQQQQQRHQLQAAAAAAGVAAPPPSTRPAGPSTRPKHPSSDPKHQSSTSTTSIANTSTGTTDHQHKQALAVIAKAKSWKF